MGKIINSYILPHPPIIVPEVGRGKEKNAAATIEAVIRVAREIAKDKPTTIIISSPHAPCFSDYVYISDATHLSGNFAKFGCPQVKLSFENNMGLASLIAENARSRRISAGSLDSRKKEIYGIDDMLDHGAMVPLYFISKELKDFKLVLISTPFMPIDELYKFGHCIREAVNSLGEDVVYVASGDLSHRLTKDAPAGYNARGREYDEYLIKKLGESETEALLTMDEEFMEAAGECGTRSFIMMLGALEGSKIKTDIYSYEGPFGVGYLVAKVNNIDKNESVYVSIARETLEVYIKEKKKITIPEGLPLELLKKRAGVFVSIKKNGQLRGCIGTIAPTKKNIAEEIIYNAISAGTMDPRFEAVGEDELSSLVYSVDVLGEPERIYSLDELDVKKYGVIVTCGNRRGLLLPDLEGVDTSIEQVEIALQKAGIGKSENYEMERFEIIRYK